LKFLIVGCWADSRVLQDILDERENLSVFEPTRSLS
jgi:hypothetical protein